MSRPDELSRPYTLQWIGRPGPDVAPLFAQEAPNA
jgi:hypothetical protein